MNTWWVRLLSIAIAIFLYFFIRSDSNRTEVQLSIPVEIVNVPDSRVVTAVSSQQVLVSLRGPGFLVSQVVLSRPQIRIALPEGRTERYSHQLASVDLQLPVEVEVVGFLEPRSVELTIDELITDSVPVVVPRIGSPPPGVVLESIEVIPNAIKVRGPRSVVKRLGRLETEPLDVRQLGQQEIRELVIRVPSGPVELDRRTVRVNLLLKAKRGK